MKVSMEGQSNGDKVLLIETEEEPDALEERQSFPKVSPLTSALVTSKKSNHEFAVHILNFHLDQAFNVTYYNDHNYETYSCSIPSKFTLKCTSQDIKHDWNIETTKIFSPYGYSNYMININKVLTTYKMYCRLKDGETMDLEANTSIDPDKNQVDVEYNIEAFE